MNTIEMEKQKAHALIDHIFTDLLPAQGMAERPEQLKLSHRMLDTMLEGGIALCDAGTGIGKTYAYLVAAGGMPSPYPDIHLQHRLAKCGAKRIPPSAFLCADGRQRDRPADQGDHSQG